MADDLSRPGSADERAHGAHGRGDGREQRIDDTPVTPATKEASHIPEASTPDAGEKLKQKLTGYLSDASFGDAPSGGSTVDKRPPGNK